jgi:ABC-type nitrate/sulfonate/bicarbonate transport system ATPase subunit
MGDLLRRIRQKDRLAVLLVTHDIQGAVRLATTIVGVRTTYGRPIYRVWESGNPEPDKLRDEIELWISDHDG